MASRALGSKMEKKGRPGSSTPATATSSAPPTTRASPSRGSSPTAASSPLCKQGAVYCFSEMACGTAVVVAAEGKKGSVSFMIYCTKSVEGKIMEIVLRENFLQERIKVAGGKAGNLGDSFTVTCDKSMVTVTSDGNFSKRVHLYADMEAVKHNFVEAYLEDMHCVLSVGSRTVGLLT